MIRAILVVKQRFGPGLHPSAYPLINLFFYPSMNPLLIPFTFPPMLPFIGGRVGGRTGERLSERAGGRAGGPSTHASTHHPSIGWRAEKWSSGRRSFLKINFVPGWLMGSPGQN